MDDELTQRIIGAAFRVHNQLGYGFLESIYEKALAIELAKTGIAFTTQSPVKVYYDQKIIGEFACDVLVEQRLLLELKSVANLALCHEVQLVNYLTATKIDVGLLINFGPGKVDIKRKYRTYRPCKEK